MKFSKIDDFYDKIENNVYCICLQIEHPTRPAAGRPSQYNCPYCPVVMRRPDHMQAHIRKHTGERPFSCPHCQLSFNQKSNLNTHIRKYHVL